MKANVILASWLTVAVVVGLVVVAAAVVGLDAIDQARVDAAIVAADGSPNRSRLGGNACIAVSLAVAVSGLVIAATAWRLIAGRSIGSAPFSSTASWNLRRSKRVPSSVSALVRSRRMVSSPIL